MALAGVPLLRSTQAGFVPRPASEIAILLAAAYGPDHHPSRLHSRLGAIAKALNSGDFALAAIAAVQTRTPELSREAALRLANADEELAKYNFNPDEPRDWHSRWTTGGAAAPASTAAPEIESDRADEPHVFDHRQRRAENATPSAVTTLSDTGTGEASGKPDDSDDSRDPISLEQTFERKYDDLGPVDFAKEVIQFGDRLGREGKTSRPPRWRLRSPNIPFFRNGSRSGLLTTTSRRRRRGTTLCCADPLPGRSGRRIRPARPFAGIDAQ